MNIYVLSYSYYEEYSPIYLGHENEYSDDAFKIITDNAVGEASLRAVAESGGEYVGWQDVVRALAKVLKEKHGFVDVSLPESNYWGPSIIRNQDSGDHSYIPEAVFKHNAAVSLVIEEAAVLRKIRRAKESS